MRGQAQGGAATGRHDVDVAGLDEGDRVAADVGKAQQARVAGRHGLGQGGKAEGKRNGGDESKHRELHNGVQSPIVAFVARKPESLKTCRARIAPQWERRALFRPRLRRPSWPR